MTDLIALEILAQVLLQSAAAPLKKALLDEKIIKLLQLRQQLDWCIGCGCLSMNECPLRNPNDQLGEQSAGAHFNQILFEFDNKHLISK